MKTAWHHNFIILGLWVFLGLDAWSVCTKVIWYRWNTPRFPATIDKGKPFWGIETKIDNVKVSYPKTLSMLLKRARNRGCHQASDEIGCSTTQAAPTLCRTKIRSATLSQGAVSARALLIRWEGLGNLFQHWSHKCLWFGVTYLVRKGIDPITISQLDFVCFEGAWKERHSWLTPWRNSRFPQKRAWIIYYI